MAPLTDLDEIDRRLGFSVESDNLASDTSRQKKNRIENCVADADPPISKSETSITQKSHQTITQLCIFRIGL